MSHQSDLISQDIESYLHSHENKELLRFLTCGSVDDGKSTLIGRLLHDSKMVYEDQLSAIKKLNKSADDDQEFDLALLVDGLQAEREQGITIDVAYRYFSTDKRKFIIADTPGHEQYTRNMATGASNCDLAIILIDARHGVQTQTRRHSFITSKLGIKHTIVAINKMDLVDFSEQRFEEIKADYLSFAAQLEQQDIHFVPISALNGDNVVNPSQNMAWYSGRTLINSLEDTPLESDYNFEKLRFPVQYVNRPNLNFRGYCGTITSGVIKVGDQITVLPSNKTSKVASIVTFDGELQEAHPPMAITLTLEDEIDISRSDVITHSKDNITASDEITATLVWMSEQDLSIGRTYDIKLLAGKVAGSISNIIYKTDINTLQKRESHKLALNETALCNIKLERPIIADSYRELPATGSFIIIDRLSNATVGAGMIESAVKPDNKEQLFNSPQLTSEQKAQRFGQKPAIISFSSDHPNTLKTALYTLEKRLTDKGRAVVVLLKDKTDKNQTDQLLAFSAQQLVQCGLIVLCEQSTAINSHFCIKLEEKVLNSEKIDTFITDLASQDLI